MTVCKGWKDIMLAHMYEYMVQTVCVEVQRSKMEQGYINICRANMLKAKMTVTVGGGGGGIKLVREERIKEIHEHDS